NPNRDRGPVRSEPPQPTAWLEPQTPVLPPAEEEVSDEFAGGFDDLPFAEATGDDEEFAEGVVEEATPVETRGPEPVQERRAYKPPAPPALPVDDEDAAEFGAGLDDDDAGF